jgi:hypothetical protein
MRRILYILALAAVTTAQTGSFVTGPCENTPMCKCKWSMGKRTADCSNQRFDRIPTTLSPTIQALVLDGNPLRSLGKDAFKTAGLLNVQTLSLRGCAIEEVDPNAFRDLKIMTHLDLSSNNMTKIDPQTFDGNEGLKTLKLSNNPIFALKPYQFPPLSSLKTIDLSHCRLKVIERTSFKNLGASVESVMLNNNELAFIREEVFIPLINLKSITLHTNPWVCDCRLKNFRDWVVNKKLFDRSATCSEPSRLGGKKWDAVLAIEFACKPDIEMPLPRVFGAPGVDATLSCKVTGSPVPTIRWVVNGRIVNNNTHPTPFADQTYFIMPEKISHDGVESWYNLTITNPSDHDLGKYLCVAENNGGVMEKEVILTFDDPSSYTTGIPITDEQWHILIGASVCILILLILLAIICYCCLCKKGKKKSSKNRMDESGQGGGLDSQKLLTPSNGVNGSIMAVTAGSNPIPKPPRMGDYVGLPQTDLYKYEMEMQALPPRAPSVVSNAKQSSTSSTGSDNAARGAMTISRASFGDHGEQHFPDLLDHRHIYRTANASADNILSPASLMLSPQQQVQYAHLVSPFQRSGTLPLPHHQPHQPMPFPNSQSYHVQPLPVVHQRNPHQSRPGYVTLPRRPRAGWSVPRDTPSPSSSTMSRTEREPIYDGIGPRTSADGSSRLSLNKSMMSSPSGSLGPHQPPQMQMQTLGRGHNLPPYYAPIEELQECPPTPKKKPSLPKSTPNIVKKIKEEPSESLAPSSSEATLIEENISAYLEPFGTAEKPKKDSDSNCPGSTDGQSNRNSIASNESELAAIVPGGKENDKNGHTLSSSTPIKNDPDTAVLAPVSNGRIKNGGPPKTLPKPKVKPVPPPKPKKSFQEASLDAPLISFQDEGVDGSEV